jgi:hypothetical protein
MDPREIKFKVRRGVEGEALLIAVMNIPVP